MLGGDQPHTGKIGGVTPRVSGQKRASEHGGMSPDEEVGQDIAFRSTLATIARKGFAGKKSGPSGDIFDDYSQFFQFLVQRGRSGE